VTTNASFTTVLVAAHLQGIMDATISAPGPAGPGAEGA